MINLFFKGKEFYRILAALKGKNKKKLENVLSINLEIKKSGTITIKSINKDFFSEYIASKVLEAISFGFNLQTALQLKDTEYDFKKLNIKFYSRASQQERARARLIGKKGKTKTTIENLTDCDIILTNNTVAILGKVNNVKVATKAVESLLRGSKQANIYKYLEKNRSRLKALEKENIEEFIEINEKDSNRQQN